jgi:anthranilate synthase component I
MPTPTFEEYRIAARGGCAVPVFRDFPADVETPLTVYWKLAQGETHSFLLESVTGGEQLARYSLIGTRPTSVLRAKGERCRLDGQEVRLGPGQDPLHLLPEFLGPHDVARDPELPAFAGGAVGLVAYDFVRFLERLPDTPPDDLELDDVALMRCDTVAVFDHAKNVLRVISLADGTDEGYRRAETELDRVAGLLAAPLPPLPTESFSAHPVAVNVERERFEEGVRRIKEYIAAGDGIQMVPSMRFETAVDAHPVSVYRALRSLNPSPYMFLLRFEDFDLVGASPELLVSLHGDRARVRPIAGTRPRGRTPEEDAALAEELLADEKERAEHIMLVDLGRNDLGRVCEYGSVRVNELMTIERYSHVMHIVSDVTGTLPPERNALDLLRACFPAGTVTGAPKVRAMQIIDEIEPTRRGAYAGAIGFLSHTGDMDTCIAIRTILIKGGKAYVQAGAGVVHDSDPAKEYEECRNKARAALRAIELAQQGQ